MKTILVLGFGRMGLTHATILSGILGASNVEFTIVDPSLPSRVIARLLFPKATIVGFGQSDRILRDGNAFDLALVTTPPGARGEVVRKLTGVARRIFLEKPVLQRLSGNQMSGYVLQHAPLNARLRGVLSTRRVRAIRGSLVTNVDFEAVKRGWRATRFGSVLHEFGGHVLSVIGACMPEASLFTTPVPRDALTVTRLDRNGAVFGFRDAGIDVEVALIAGDDRVRKASYDFLFTTDAGNYRYDMYALRDGERELTNLAAGGVSTGFYVRGFEFTRQMEALVRGDLDVLSPDQISNFESILGMVESTAP